MDPATDWVQSLGRYALDYDGTNDYTPTTQNTIGGVSSMSCECWVNLRSLAAGFVGLFGSWAAATANRSWTLFVNANNWSFGTSNGTSQALATAGTSATLNTLTHVCGVKNASTNKLYINGVEVASTSTHTGTVTVGNNAVLIGALRTDDPSPFYANCQVWQATCWNRELSTREIRLAASRIGIAFEISSRRRSRVSVLASLRYNIFTGNVGSLEVIGAS